MHVYTRLPNLTQLKDAEISRRSPNTTENVNMKSEE